MTTLRIQHRTRFLYSRPVQFGPHRLMLRPRDGHDMRILDSSLAISPPAALHWEFDVFGNSIAIASFNEAGDELVIESDLRLRRFVVNEPAVDLAPRTVPFPFAYDEDELIDLAPWLRVQCPGDQAAVDAWLRQSLPEHADSSFEVLRSLGAAIHDGFAYRPRDEQGVQSPGHTLATGSGTCRDFAYLFMEAARRLGFAARFVTGYLYDPAADGVHDGSAALSGGGSTHAWADIYVPGGGWIEFDPTNRIIAGAGLIRVATTRSPSQALPVQGSYRHDGASLLSMDVSVAVSLSA